MIKYRYIKFYRRDGGISFAVKIIRQGKKGFMFETEKAVLVSSLKPAIPFKDKQGKVFFFIRGNYGKEDRAYIEMNIIELDLFIETIKLYNEKEMADNDNN